MSLCCKYVRTHYVRKCTTMYKINVSDVDKTDIKRRKITPAKKIPADEIKKRVKVINFAWAEVKFLRRR